MAVLPFRTRPPRPVPPDAFEKLALAEAGALYRTAVRLTRSTVEAEDLVQETYLKAFRAAGRFERGTNLRAWLFTILMNTFRNSRRDAARDLVDVDSTIVEQAASRAGQSEGPEQALVAATLDEDLRAALDGMPPAFREAVWLRDVEEFTYAEIAAMLDIPVGTVMSRISRGRRLLHDRLVSAREAGVESVPESDLGPATRR